MTENSGSALPAPGQQVELRIEDLAFGGRGLARLDGYVVFVDGAVPGQRVRAIIRKRKRSFAEATVAEVLERSPLEITPVCKHFGICGGCRLQNLSYEKQVEYKARQVHDLLQRIGGLETVPLEEPLAAPSPYFYRNKMEFSFSDQPYPNETGGEGELALGLHRRGRFDQVVDLEECHLQDPLTPTILRIVREFARASGLAPYSNRTHEGFWRFLVLRKGFNTGQWMVNFVTTEAKPEILSDVVPLLQEHVPGLHSVVNNVNTGRGGVAFGEQEVPVWGETTIEEKLGRYVFSISANSFFQTNTAQAVRLYDKVLEYADLQGDETVLDLYCGTGSISIYVSSHCKLVIGIEVVDDAVADAWRNCERNGVGNCQFLAGDVRDLLRDASGFAKKYGHPDVLIVDPPREGVHPKVIKRLPHLQARRIVYVSCNPSTQARDLALLGRWYRVERVCPVDMFPQTPHVESVALLVRK